MSSEHNPADDRYELDQCVDEIKRLQSELTTLRHHVETLRAAVEEAASFASYEAGLGDRSFAKLLKRLKAVYAATAPKETP